MGWASGSQLAQDVWDLIRPFLYVSERQRVARQLIDLFENMDCDTIDEAEQLCQDAGRCYDEVNDQIVYREAGEEADSDYQDVDDEPGNHER